LGKWGCLSSTGKEDKNCCRHKSLSLVLLKINANLFGKAKMVLANLFAKPAFALSVA